MALERNCFEKTYTYEEAQQKGRDQVGVVTGAASGGLIDVDCDAPEAAIALSAFLPDTGLVTGWPDGNKRHWFYKVTEDISWVPFRDPEQGDTIFEVRGNGRFTMVPPSKHPDGFDLAVIQDGEPALVSRDALLEAARKAFVAVVIARRWKEGSRHNICLALGGVLAHAGWSEDDVVELIEVICEIAKDDETASRLKDVETTFNRTRDNETVSGLPTLETLVKKKVTTAISKALNLRKPERSITPDGSASSVKANDVTGLSALDLTHQGLAPRFAERVRGRLCFLEDEKKWLVWNGKVWRDASVDAEGIAQEFIRDLTGRLSGDNLLADQKVYCNANSLRSSGGMKGLLEASKSHLRASSSEFDTDPYLFNCQNGVINLRDGVLMEHDPSLKLRQITNVSFDPNAKSPVFEKYLATTFGTSENELEVRDFVLKFLGYCLTGDTKEQCFFVCYGDGANGKGTLLNLIQEMLSDYAKTIDTKALTPRSGNSGGASSDIARLEGARFVLGSETGKSEKLDDARLKQISGSDKIAVRELYQSTKEHKPTYKIVLMTNHKPQFDPTDDAVWRRIRLIPFMKKFEADQCDKDLDRKLRDESSGVLNMLINGCLKWQQEGLQMPLILKEATQSYRSEDDSLGSFLTECCEATQKGGETFAKLYSAYVQHCEDVGYTEKSKKDLGAFLKLKYEPGKVERSRGYKGISLKIDPNDSGDGGNPNLDENNDI